MIRSRIWALLAAMGALGAGEGGGPPSDPGATLATSLWRDEPRAPRHTRLDPLHGIPEPSDLLLRGGELLMISDASRDVYRLALDGPGGSARLSDSWEPEGLPEVVDIDFEALAELPSGEVLVGSESSGDLYVLSSLSRKVCAVWRTGVTGRCLLGRPNCGVEAVAVLPNGHLFVAKEREPRAAYLFDLPATPCADTTLSGRTYLMLPSEVGPDVSAATYDSASGHLLLVARSRQKVIEVEPPVGTPGDTSPRSLVALGSFGYGATEDTLAYSGLPHAQVEGIAVDADRVLYLVVDSNNHRSATFGNSAPALLRFYPAQP